MSFVQWCRQGNEGYMRHIAVIGAGAWGTALAGTLASVGRKVRMLVYEPELADTINSDHVNTLYLPAVRLDDTITASTDPDVVLDGADLVFMVVPSEYAVSVLDNIGDGLSDKTVVIATKGIEHGSLSLMSELIMDRVSGMSDARLAVLSGPSFAKEVVERLPAAVVAASRHKATADRVQDTFRGSNLRIYTSDDIVGVQIAGSAKNVIAIAVGISDGLGCGHNARAAIITRGAVEIARLGISMGARAETFSGLAGTGDLVLTCTGDLSRNRTVGLRLGRGETLDEIRCGMVQVAEGVSNARCFRSLAARHNIEMPIAEQVYRILYEKKLPQEAVKDLMSRKLKRE